MLIDRGEQTARLMRLVAEAADGRERFGVISGAAASGKTELLNSVSQRAAAGGVRLLSAVASSSEQGFPYAVLEQLLQSVPPRHASESPLLPSAGPGAGPVDSIAVLRGFHRTLTALTGDAPLLIAIDDIQFTDPQSVDCLAYALRRCRSDALSVVVTRGVRPGAAPAALEELLYQPQVCHVRLGPLTEGGVHRLLADRLGSTEAAGLAPAFHAVSGGNPLLVRGLVDDHVSCRDGMSKTGEMFRNAALVCVHRSGTDALLVAHGIALLGRVDSIPLLSRLVGVEERTVRQSVTDLTAAGILNDGGFRHDGVRAALVEDLTGPEISRLRRRAAQLLYEDGATATAVAGQLLSRDAPHTIEEPRFDEWVPRLLREAARQAIADDRVAFATDCLQLAERHCSDEQEKFVIRSTLVQIIWQIKPLAWAQQLQSLARPAREGLLPPSQSLRVVAGLLWNGRVEDAAAILLRVAGEAAETSDLRLHSELRVIFLSVACNFPGAVAHIQLPLGQAEPCEQLPASVDAPGLTAFRALQAVLGHGADAGATAAAEQVLQTTRLSDRTVQSLWAALMTLVYADCLSTASAWCDRFLAESTTRHAPGWQAAFSAIRGLVSLRRGHLADAAEYAETAMEHLPAHGWGVAVGLPLSVLVEARTAMGHHDVAAELLSRPVPEPMFLTRYGLHYLYARGRHQLATGRHHAALTDFRQCEEQMTAWGLDSPTLVPWRVGAAETWLLLDSPGLAARLTEEQLARAGTARTRTRGLALRVLAAGRPLAERPAMLDHAVALLQQGGDWYEAARALADLGRAHDELGDVSRARLLVRRAWRMADGCNAEELSRSLLPTPVRGVPAETAGAAVRADDSAVSSLTDAERRVASLAAYGYTNREIAAKLFITVSTVEQHLTRVYRKINISQRQDLPISLDTDVAYTA